MVCGVATPHFAATARRFAALKPSFVHCRASTAARSASARFIPATRITARVGNSTRSGEIVSHFASQEIATPCFPNQTAFVRFLSPPLSTRRQASDPYVAQQGDESCPKNVDVVVGTLAT